MFVRLCGRRINIACDSRERELFTHMRAHLLNVSGDSTGRSYVMIGNRIINGWFS